MDIKYLKTGDLIPYSKNAKKHPDDQVEHIANSIKTFGFQQPIVVDQDNVVVIGHGRLLAAMKLRLDTVPCVVLSEFEWDLDFLDEELDGILNIDMSDFGFDLSFYDKEPEEIIEDNYDGEVPEEPKAKVGDIYQLGNHRLICGDSTDVTVIDRLMDGVKADMVFSDPPYNIAGKSTNFTENSDSPHMRALAQAEWDKNFNISEALDNILIALSENATVYICTSHFLAGEIWQWMDKWAKHVQYCVWSKPNPMPSLSKRHWTWNTELICYATRGKHTFNFPKEGHALSTWTINTISGKTGHPTEKPVEVPAMAISHSSKENDVVLDLFGGSGSTLIACEQLNRKCYMCELDPHYVDVIIQRYINLKGTDDDVFLLRDGKKIPYSEVIK